jgi:hypothetical protein
MADSYCRSKILASIQSFHPRAIPIEIGPPGRLGNYLRRRQNRGTEHDKTAVWLIPSYNRRTRQTVGEPRPILEVATEPEHHQKPRDSLNSFQLT